MQTAEHPPPAPGGRRVRLRYMTQVKTRPPTFVVFASVPEAVPEDYKRFLVNGLRRDFDMPGTPIRLYLRAGDNPYAGRRKANVTSARQAQAAAPRRLSERAHGLTPIGTCNRRLLSTNGHGPARMARKRRARRLRGKPLERLAFRAESGWKVAGRS